MTQLKSSTRLFLLIGILFSLMLAIGGLGRFTIVNANKTSKTIYEERLIPMGLLGDVQHQLLRSRLLIDASVQDPRPQVIAANLAELTSTSAVISKTWAAYMSTYRTKEEEKLATQFTQDHLKFEQEGLAPASAALLASDMDRARVLIREKILPLDAPLQFGLESLMESQLIVAKQEYQAALDRAEIVRVVMAAAIVAGLLFAVLTGLAMLRAHRQELVDMIEREAHADLTRQMDEKNHLLQALTESEFRWKFAIEGAGDGVWDRDLQTGQETYSRRWKEMLGYAEDEILPDHQEWEGRIHPDDRVAVLASDAEYIAGKAPSYEIECRLRCKDGTYKWILSRGMIVSRDPNGKPLRTIGTHTDITQRRKSEDSIRLAAKVFEHALEGIMITALDGSIMDVNDAFTQITGYSREEALGQNPRLLSSGRHSREHYQQMWRDLAETGIWVGENWNRRKNGEIYAQIQKVSTVRDEQGKAMHYVSLFSDITSAKNHQQELERIARYDSLTKLPNRALLAERLEQALVQTQRRGQHLAVVFIDLDGFKAVNDTHGHEAGDHLLMTLAERMKTALRDGDILARLGGDEFVAVLLDLADVDASAPMLNRLLDAAARPFQFGQARLQVSASLGVTFYPQTQDQAQELEPDQLLRQADQAMYQAKQSGKNRFHVFDAEQDRKVRARHENMQSIERALSAGEFLLQYQPKVNLRTGAVIGVEALIRWQHPQQGLRQPSDFLPMIEDHPLAVSLGQWVIQSALTQIERWREVGLNMAVSVNIGRRHLMQADFVDQLREALAQHPGLAPNCLELELLEANAINDLDPVSKVIQACRSIGVECVLDDFGSGYSSLTALKKLPVKYLKIDQDFIRDMLGSSDSLLILIGVLKLASAFDLKVIAEGVETAQHGFMLLELGCELAQGYGIARPMPADDLPAWVKRWKPDPSWRDVALLPSWTRS
ncbi:MAG: EAL domain-containing protein [Comamonadaceae bacterium]